MAKIENFEYRHISNTRKFMHIDLFNRYSPAQLHIMAEGIKTDNQLTDSEKKDLSNYISNYVARKYSRINLRDMKKENLEALKKEVKAEMILKGSDKDKILKIISRQRNENSKNENLKKIEERERQQKAKINNEEKPKEYDEQQKNNEKRKKQREDRIKLNSKTPEEYTNRELIEMFAKKKYAYDSFLSANNNVSPEILRNRDNRRAEIKKLQEEIDKRGISPELSHGFKFAKKQRAEIEARYLSGKDFRNYTFNEWVDEENQINEKLKKIDKKLETCFEQDKANELQREKSKYRQQLVICQKFGEKALDRQVIFEGQEKSESATILKEENKKNEIESEEIKNGEISTITEEEKIKQEEIIEKERIVKLEEERKARLAAMKAEMEAEMAEEAKREEERKAKIVAEQAEKDAESKKGFWTKFKEKVSKNWKKLVAPVLAMLAVGGSSNAMLNESKQKEDNDKSNITVSDKFIGPERPIENFNASIINEEPNKESSQNSENKEEQTNDFRENLKVEVQLEKEFTLGDVVHIDEGCNYYENSMEGGNHNTVGTQNQWRSSGEYMIDGLAVTYQDSNGDWKVAKLKDDKTNGGNYGNLGLNSDEYVKSVMQENGLTEEQVRIMYHINKGTKQGEHPTGWIEAPEEGFELESKYEKHGEQSELEKTEKLSELEK